MHKIRKKWVFLIFVTFKGGCYGLNTSLASVAAWRSGNGVGRINEVTLRRARLVLGWVTVSGFDSRRRHFISVCNQSPGRLSLLPSVGR